ncbi:MAG: Ig-like domain-containing protein [Gemmataceae bacterium]
MRPLSLRSWFRLFTNLGRKLWRPAWFQGESRSTRRGAAPRARLQIEQLEVREVMSTLGFLNGNLSVAENAGMVNLTVQRDNAAGSASVAVQLTDGTTTPSDYFFNSVPLQFMDGQQTAFLAISILDNWTPQPDRYFTLALHDPSPGWSIDPAHAAALVTILDNDANSPPLANDDTYSACRGQTLAVPANGLLANDSDPNFDSLSISAVNGAPLTSGQPIPLPSGASLILNADGTFAYLPATGFTGQDTFTYTISDGIASSTATVRIDVVDEAPWADSDTYEIRHDQTLVVSLGGAYDSLLSNDYDFEGDPLTITAINGAVFTPGQPFGLPSGASLSINADGSFTYTPAPQFVGEDTFVYTVSDGVASSTAIAMIQVNNEAPWLTDDSYAIAHDQTLTVGGAPYDPYPLLSNDYDFDQDALTLTAINGQAFIPGAAQTLASGALLTLNADGTFIYTPAPHFVGADTFTYTVSDGIASATALAKIDVTDQTPVAANDAYSVEHDLTLIVGAATSLLSNDYQSDADPLTITAINGAPFFVGGPLALPSGASLALNNDGTFTYTPAPQFLGQDSFTYALSDGVASASATVTIAVEGPNTPPTAVDYSYSVTRNGLLDTGDLGLPSLLENDSDPDGDTLFIANYTPAGHGSLTVAPDGYLIYQPETDYVGVDGFAYTLSDGESETTGTVSIAVANTLPEATPAIFRTPLNQGLEASVTGSDDDGDPLTFQLLAPPSTGDLTLNPNGFFVYQPADGFTGEVTFSFAACDGLEPSAAATVRIGVVRTVYFDGGGDGFSWQDPLNWDSNALPTAFDDIIIPQTYSVVLTTTETVHSLANHGSFEDRGALTLNDASSSDGVFNLNQGQLTLADQAGLELRGVNWFSSAVVHGPGTVRLVDGQLTVAGVTHVDCFAQGGGSVDTIGTLQIEQSWLWESGTVEAVGETIIAPSAAATIATDSLTHILKDQTITNQGRLDWYDNGSILVHAPALLRNEAEFYIHGDGAIQGALNVANSGTLTRDESFGQATLDVTSFVNTGDVVCEQGTLVVLAGSFQNPGEVNVHEGTFALSGPGSSTGSFVVSSDRGQLVFQADHTIAQGGSISSAGAVSFRSGQVNILGSYASQATAITGGVASFASSVSLSNVLLSGAGVLEEQTGGIVTIADSMLWSAGTVRGSGLLLIAPAATLTIQPDQDAAGQGRVLQSQLKNSGRLIWYTGTIELRGASLTNAGMTQILGNDTLSGDANSRFYNTGVLSKEGDTNGGPVAAGATPMTTLDVWLQNTGSIRVQTGALNLKNAFNAAPIILSKDTDLFVGGYLRLDPGSSIVGPATQFGAQGYRFQEQPGQEIGAVTVLAEGTLDVQTSSSIADLRLYGTLTGPQDLRIGNYLSWGAGSMSGAGRTIIGSDAILFITAETAGRLVDRVIDNWGKVAWSGARETLVRGPSGAWSPLENDPGYFVNYNAVAQAAGNGYMSAIQQAKDALAQQESQADLRYQGAEGRAADAYAAAIDAAETAYDQAVQAAESQRANPPAGTEAMAEAVYSGKLAQAEEQRDTAIAKAGAAYYKAEDDAYAEYVRLVSDSADPAHFEADYQEALRVALRNFHLSLWDAAPYAQSDSIAYWMSRPLDGTRTIAQLANDIHDLLAGAVPAKLLPAGQVPPPSPASFLRLLSADVRASLVVQYRQGYGVELGQAIADAYPPSISALVDAFNRAQYDRAIAALRGLPDPPPQPSLWDQIENWVDNAVTWVGGAFTSAMDALSNAWDATTTFITNTATRLVTDPLGFIQDVGQAIVDTGAVVANTFTFGAIPALNAHTTQLLRDKPMLQFVQFTAVIGREVLVGMVTGGAANLAFGAARRVGQAGLNLVARAVGGVRAEAAVTRAASAIACRITSAQRMIQPYVAYANSATMAQNVIEARAAIAAGDLDRAAVLLARTGGMIPSTARAFRETGRFMTAVGRGSAGVRNFLSNCFAAGTPIVGEHGSKAIERYAVGEKVWARDENDPDAPLQLREIEECFQTEAEICHVHVEDQVIGTTDEHPFWVRGKGWTAARDLEPGDLLVSHDGQVVAVEEVFPTGERATVYNFRVGEHHTYFVGGDDWSFAVWAHNACVAPVQRGDSTWGPRTVRGKTVYGKAQNTTGGANDPHATHIDAVVDRLAKDAPAGSYFVLNRSWRTALGRTTVPSTLKGREPDIIFVQPLGNGKFAVSAYEVRSGRQSVEEMLDRLDEGWNTVTKKDIEKGDFFALAIGQFP